MLTRALLALCAAAAAAAPVRLNAGGPVVPAIGWRGDSGAFVSGATAAYGTSASVPGGGSWASVYQTHRFATAGSMRFAIPAPPAATYTLKLLFAETWATAPGVRQFRLRVNGADVAGATANGKPLPGALVDVFAMAGGRLRPLFVSIPDVTAAAGAVTVDFVRVPGKNNPMVSGLFLEGPAADSLLGAEGFDVQTAPSTATAFPAAAPEAPVVPAVGTAGAAVDFSRKALLKGSGAGEFIAPLSAAVAYGPDGRLYVGSLESKIRALSVSKALRVTKVCTASTLAKPPAPQFPRQVTGVAFDPSSNALRVYVTTATHFWLRNKNFTSFTAGWQNGKVQSITMAGPAGCFNDDLTDVVTGLPVSNHGHAPNAILFLPDGKMLVGVGGVTNGGNISPELGGIPASPYSGAIIACPKAGAFIKYSNAQDPAKAKVVGGGCTVYASGFRNTYGMALHSNGRVYATDNGPHDGESGFSTNCAGGTIPSKIFKDRLHLVEPGRCHGHPNKNRGECLFRDPKCVPALLDELPPSTNGVAEYRSNWFDGALKGDLLLTRFEKGEGEVSRVQLNAAGKIAPGGFTQSFWGASSLSIAEGPRGELMMPRLYSGKFLVAVPVAAPPAGATFVVSVFPRSGPAGGGTRVTIHGAGFGAKPAAQFGAGWCQDVVVIDSESFSCSTPPGAKNTQVTLKVYEGSRAYVGKTPDFWYF